MTNRKHKGPPVQHGETLNGTKSAEYRAWSRMKTRCINPNDAAYDRYGGRGITVCDRWMSSFENFLADMGRRPSPQHSIDRINNDGQYEPTNCRWATRSEQNSNYTRNRIITFDGRSQLLSKWAAETGIDANTIAARLDVFGWTVSDALSMPVGARSREPRGKDKGTHCPNGHEYTPENSGRNSHGWRFCRACMRERNRNYMRAKRAGPQKGKRRNA